VDQYCVAAVGRRIGFIVAVAAMLAAAGCGGGPTMGRVSGTVSAGGKPLDAGTVTFIATDGQRPNATGAIQPGGSYKLQTAEPGDGAVVGDYQVAISDVDSSTYNNALPGAPVAKPKSAIPSTYQDAKTSGLTARVERGNNKFDFDLKSK
jgi:hypothetical protein